jgi:protein-disulfide isomerase
MSKREELKAKRKKQMMQQRLTVIGIIVVGAALIAGFLIYPNLPKPVGTFAVPTQVAYPKVNGNSMGDPNAPVKMVIYADFQCPACGNWTKDNEPDFIAKYVATNKVYFTYTPFSFIDDNGPGTESKDAAAAAFCAMDQGKFWQFHDMLYANQTSENSGDFTASRLEAFAQSLGMNTSQFTTCFTSGKYKDQVLQDKAQGAALGVNSTPSFAIDGKLVVIQQSYTELYTALDAALAAKGK